MAFDFGDKQRVKDAVDIVDLVGGYLQLRRDGRNFKALCPWHDDSRPSLQVNAERQSFKCWVCDIGGDVFTFIMKMEGVPFPEALTMLAERAGIRLEQQKGPRPQLGSPDDKKVLLAAMQWADQQYHRALLHDREAEVARKYLDDRGINADNIAKFQLGFAPDSWDWLLQKSHDTPYSAKVLEKVGLVQPRQTGGGYYDRFRARVLFPIFDSQARAVGLGGRVLPNYGQADAAKYLNSAETPLFAKHKLLYGLHIARDAIRKSGTALIMEGYTDCIMAHQFGIDNAVAVLGTALGTPQIRLLRGYGGDVRFVLVLDGDEAGRKRANEVLSLFVAEDADLRVLTLPEEFDPCEILLERGADAFRTLVDNAKDALTHAVETATAGVDLARDVHGAAHALEQLLGIVSKSSRPDSETGHLREQKILSRLAFDFRIPEERIRERLAALRQKSPTRVISQPSPQPAADSDASEPRAPRRIEALDRELMEILLRNPAILPAVNAVVGPRDILSEPCQEIYLRMLELAQQGSEIDFARLLLEFDDPEIKNLLVEFDEAALQKRTSDFEMALRDVLAGFERRKTDLWRHSQTAVLKERRLEEDQELDFLRQLAQQERNRQGISRPTEG